MFILAFPIVLIGFATFLHGMIGATERQFNLKAVTIGLVLIILGFTLMGLLSQIG